MDFLWVSKNMTDKGKKVELKLDVYKERYVPGRNPKDSNLSASLEAVWNISDPEKLGYGSSGQVAQYRAGSTKPIAPTANLTTIHFSSLISSA